MYKRILIVVNDQPATQAAIGQGIEVARVHHAEVLFMYVLPTFNYPIVDVPSVGMLSAEQFYREAREGAASALRAATARAEASDVFSINVIGTAEHADVYVAEEASRRRCDLIVVGTEGSNALMRVLTGSIVPGLITNATVPVMVCPMR